MIDVPPFVASPPLQEGLKKWVVPYPRFRELAVRNVNVESGQMPAIEVIDEVRSTEN